MDLTSYVPFYITAIANGWTSASSRAYLRDFGIGIVEWRVLATLLSQESATVLEVARLTGTDVAAASRAMQALQGKSLVAAVPGRFRGRTKPFAMTAEGRIVAEQIRSVAQQRAAALLVDLTDAEQAEFLTLLRRVHDRLPSLREE